VLCRWKHGYKNVIGKGIELNQAGTDTPLMMESWERGQVEQQGFVHL